MATIPTTTLALIGNLTLPPTPNPGTTTLPAYQDSVAIWTRQVQTTLHQFQSAFANLTTAQIPSTPTGLYWTQALFDAAFAAKTTDDLSEGSTNLYFTDARARAAISKVAPILYDSTTGVIGLDFNTTNLKLTANQLNTIQDIDTTAGPEFAMLGIGTPAVFSFGRILTVRGAANFRVFSGPQTEFVTINGDINVPGQLTLNNDDPTQYDAVYMTETATTPKAAFQSIGSTFSDTSRQNNVEIINLTVTGGISLWTNSAERVRIDPSGNVGIGTTTPAAMLHVTGSIQDDDVINVGPYISLDTTHNRAVFGGDGVTRGRFEFDLVGGFDINSGNIALDASIGNESLSIGNIGMFAATGNIGTSGTIEVHAGGFFQGDGHALTLLDAGALATGTVPTARLPLAKADGATLGIAAFTAADFNDNGSGVVSIDYANGQKATTSQPGFLTAADWNTFNGKQAALTGVQGDIIYFSATNTISNLAKSTTASRYLSNSGTSNNPAWAQVDLTNGVTGTLPVGNGGTGTATAFTAGSVVFAGASGVYSQNNANFFWDNTAVALCLGTVTQAGRFTVLGATGAANTVGQVGASITGGAGGGSTSSTASGAGGAITITTGAGGVTTGSNSGAGGAGGLLTLKAGNGGAGALGNSGVGGGVTIQSGAGATSTSGALAPSNGGIVLVASGAGSNGTGAAGSSSGGAINITTGAGGAQSGSNGNAGQGGAITISCGISGANSTTFATGANGAAITITPGGGGGSPASVPGGTGGALNLNSGQGGNSNGGAGGAGGNIVILANAAGTSGSGGANGGSVSINPGAGSGTGVTGIIQLCNVRGNAAIGNLTPTARLHIAAGTASASSAPLKFTSGTNLTTAETGAMEYDGTNLYFTPTGTTRRTVPLVPGTDYQTPITTSVNNSGTSTTTLTTSAAACIGSITIATAGTYLLVAQFDFTFLDTFTADTNFTFTFRRTNNTPANVGNALPITVSAFSFAAGSGFTETWGVIAMPAVSYVATAGDIITVNGNGITTLNSGTWKTGNSWSITAIRIA